MLYHTIFSLITHLHTWISWFSKWLNSKVQITEDLIFFKGYLIGWIFSRYGETFILKNDIRIKIMAPLFCVGTISDTWVWLCGSSWVSVVRWILVARLLSFLSLMFWSFFFSYECRLFSRLRCADGGFCFCWS
jgi:hypothetical protein